MAANSAYFTSVSGIIKLIICLFLIITLICGCVGAYSYRIFFIVISLAGFVVELFFYLCYVLNATGKFGINWPFVDLIASIIISCLSLISFCVACAKAGSLTPQDSAASFFWAALLVLFCVDCYYSFRAWRQGSPGGNAPAPAGPNFVAEQPAGPYSNYQSEPYRSSY